MTIIVSQKGKNAEKVNRSSFALEDHLQQYIYDNPESIPLYDIKEDIQLLILAREFMTHSGPIDAVGIDRDGQLYLVETKLYKNPDKRTVVAQVMDYGASLWKQLTNFDDFLLSLNKHTQKKFNLSALEKIQEFFELDDNQVENIIEKMRDNLDEGNFKFVILMDDIEDRLKDLIIYVNQNSKFDIYGVELEYYQHDSFEIMIPKLYGAQVKKDVGTSSSSQVVFSEQDFIDAFSKVGLESKIRELLELNKEIQEKKITLENVVARKSAKNLMFDYNLPKTDYERDLNLSSGLSRGKPNETIDFWCYSPEYQKLFIEKIENMLEIETIKLDKDANYGRIAQWPLSKFTKEKLLNFFKAFP